MALHLEPVFEPKELPANVVRLPFDTPSLLLNGVLGLKEALLYTISSTSSSAARF